MGNFNPTFYLFARPSFIEGFSRVLDLGSTMQIYNESNTGEEADYKAILNDWRAVGRDMYSSIQKFKNKNNLTKTF